MCSQEAEEQRRLIQEAEALDRPLHAAQASTATTDKMMQTMYRR